MFLFSFRVFFQFLKLLLGDLCFTGERVFTMRIQKLTLLKSQVEEHCWQNRTIKPLAITVSISSYIARLIISPYIISAIFFN